MSWNLCLAGPTAFSATARTNFFLTRLRTAEVAMVLCRAASFSRPNVSMNSRTKGSGFRGKTPRASPQVYVGPAEPNSMTMWRVSLLEPCWLSRRFSRSREANGFCRPKAVAGVGNSAMVHHDSPKGRSGIGGRPGIGARSGISLCESFFFKADRVLPATSPCSSLAIELNQLNTPSTTTP